MLIKTTYFYSPPENFSRVKVFLDVEESHHLADVLRAISGDEFFVANGIGQLFRCKLEKIHSKGAVAEIIEEVESVNQPSIDLTLAIGILQSKNIETALDWSVQIGISAFAPIYMKYSQKKLGNETKFIDRLEKISLRAMKQSKRAFLPMIYNPIDFGDFLKNFGKNFDGIIYADPDGVPSVPKRMTIDGARICIIVGPEGGLSNIEKGELSEFDAVPLSLGNARLRAETAAVVAITKILVAAGNI
ncbi:16S rRNA (uracil(1498)-N(3))-methyltransferase [bacterium]|nr:16S rRNA (uracil(1498)-N(3))-methyltransferase [bacterium]